jgi:hypothetical protein
MKIARVFLIMTACGLMPGVARSQDAGWPRAIDTGVARLVVYEPQPESFDGVTLHSRVAISVKRPRDAAPLFGAVWAIATVSVDRARDQARVVSLKIDRTRFNDIPNNDVTSVVRFLEADAPRWYPPISLARLNASLHAADGYNNAAPKIVVMDRPAILLLLDGAPRLQDVAPGGLQRVVNTALPLIFDSIVGRYWFYASSGWFTTNDLLHGAWTWVDHASPEIAELVKDEHTLDSAQADGGDTASAAQLRGTKVVVATEPTELLVTDGLPHYSPLQGGELFYVTNTDSDIFLEGATQRHYIVLSGRWFEGPSVQGPWAFVPPDKLPRAFARIPENSVKANVLAFVPGTDRARDALMENAIPQIAEIPRGAATIDVQYDGSPLFTPIVNTSLEYAENTSAQVIRYGPLYYACEEGVWYVGSSPLGPWAISDRRPAGMENIPPGSPVYNTRYVYIYDSTPFVVHAGYLPGYRWSFPYHGVILYGTGWHYGGWFGRYYYPRAATWGFYPRYNPWTGWTFGMSWTPGWLAINSRWGMGWAGWGHVYGPGIHRGFWAGFHSAGWFGPGGYRPPRPPSWRPPGRPTPGSPSSGRSGVRPPRSTVQPGNNLYVRPGYVRPHPRPDGLVGRPQPVPRPGRPDAGKPDTTEPGRGRPGVRPSRGGDPRPDAGRPGKDGRGNR